MNSTFYVVTDANRRTLSFLMTADQFSDYIGVAVLLNGVPNAQWLFGDRGYDADWFSDVLPQKHWRATSLEKRGMESWRNFQIVLNRVSRHDYSLYWPTLRRKGGLFRSF